jgi:hypothetical protein
MQSLMSPSPFCVVNQCRRECLLDAGGALMGVLRPSYAAPNGVGRQLTGTRIFRRPYPDKSSAGFARHAPQCTEGGLWNYPIRDSLHRC